MLFINNNMETSVKLYSLYLASYEACESYFGIYTCYFLFNPECMIVITPKGAI